MIHLAKATQVLDHRGPDFQNTVHDEAVGLGHRRLSIIDTTSDANQPMTDPSGRYTLIFNGEIFNFSQLRQELEARGITFRSLSDTEVLLHLLILEGSEALNKLNGFFAFALYDRRQKSIFMARDRMGIKPLYYFSDNDRFLFASEMKSILAYGIEKQLDFEALHTYLQLNYIPAPRTIMKGVKKMLPGESIYIDANIFEKKIWYTPPRYNEKPASEGYEDQQKQLATLLEDAVLKRLVSDVPLGSFLSGGIDSSVIATLAARHKPGLHTFSIGYRDEPFFDETNYAQLVAKKIGSQHHVFSLTNNDLYRHVHEILDGIDEPFADSSAIAVNILSRETRKHATVALSGDGADELFGGYNKHAAFQRIIEGGGAVRAAAALEPLWHILPKSRNNKLTNLFRQLDRLGEGMKLSPKDRYWRWAGYARESEAFALLSANSKEKFDADNYNKLRSALLDIIPGHNATLNDFLYADLRLVLPDDMLTKVDRMSMAHALEVRVPFLDHRVVEFANSLPVSSKINGGIRKRIVQDTFREILPEELYNRPKKGFEVPLLKWLRTDMRSIIEDDLLADSWLREQGIFNPEKVRKLRKKLYSSDPGDTHARIWGLVVFQWWYKRYFI
jgi:asparagine synthase (glutamine-hydrolysing)